MSFVSCKENYSVGENYDVNDVITILQSAGYNDQPTKAAPSAASIALQADRIIAIEDGRIVRDERIRGRAE